MVNIMLNVDELKRGRRVCAFIRHGEKDLKNFGLTDNGKHDINNLSRLLKLLQRPIIIYSSPEARCIETAVIINSIVNNTEQNIQVSNILGKPGIQVKDEAEYTKLTDCMKCRDIFKEWKNGLHCAAMNNAKYIKSEMLNFFFNTSLKNGITIYISQSGTVACTAYSLGIADYKANDEDWVNYLEGYVLRLCNGCYYF